MSTTFTKRLFITWDKPLTWNQERTNARDAYLTTVISEGKTDENVEVTLTTIQRDFVDQTSAEEFLSACVAWNIGRTIVSSTITDI